MRARPSHSPCFTTWTACGLFRFPFCLSRASTLLLAVAAPLAFSVPASAQTNATPAEPYASLNRDAVGYAGPGREAGHDIKGPEIRIGMLVPLAGPRRAEGEALLRAAQLALEDEATDPLPGGRGLALVIGDESGPWGRASSEIVRLIVDDRAVALITSTDGRAAHLAEQVGNKVGVPVLTLSSDATTTQINLPWIFRLGANDAAQARAFAQAIYQERGFHRVFLVTERDHDGRVGGDAFDKAARQLQAPSPARLTVASPLHDADPVLSEIDALNPEAIVLWTGPELAAKLAKEIRQAKSRAPIYVCRKAAQEPMAQAVSGGNIWVAVSRPGASQATSNGFERSFQRLAGSSPSLAARQAYDTVRLIARGLRQVGPNRARLRDYLVVAGEYAGVSGLISFDGAGNNQAVVELVPMP